MQFSIVGNQSKIESKGGLAKRALYVTSSTEDIREMGAQINGIDYPIYQDSG